MLPLTFWPFGTVFLLMGIGFGVWIALTEIRPRWRWLCIILATVFAFAGYEAAGFHTGGAALTWGVIAIIAAICLWIFRLFASVVE